MARLTMWQLGLEEAIFEADIGCDDDSRLRVRHIT